jgi:hypothetical protein
MASVGTCEDDAGNRWYRDPKNPTQLYASVTSILNIKNKPGLTIGLKNGVAKYAARYRADIAGMTQLDAYNTLRNQDIVLPDWKIAGDFGTAVHQVVENIINGVPLAHDVREVRSTKTYPVSNTFTEFVPKYWGEFTRAHNVKPLLTERAIVNRALGFSGRFDAVMEVDGEIAIVDTKSNKNGPKDDVALQNTAYGMSPCIMDMETGETEPMPHITKSYVLWIREEGWNLFPLKYNWATYDAFCEHLRLFNRVAWGYKDFVGDPIHPDGIQPVTSFYR